MTNAQESKVSLVTGAGSGVGRDTALLLAEAGYAVVLIGRTAATLDATAALIAEEVGGDAEAVVIPADVSRPTEAQRVVTTTLDRFGRIDALANIAGCAPFQPIEQLTDDVIESCLAVNLKSVIYLTRAIWPTFKQQQSGAIVNVSSMASVDPFTGFNVYAAAKAGVNLFTKATADEGRNLNVTAAAVAPGAIETPMLRANFPADTLPADKTLDPMIVAGVIRDLLTGARRIEPGETVLLPSPR